MNTFDSKKRKILDFVRKEKLGVVATISPEGNPEAAVMAVSQNDKLELFFQTNNETRKYKNLQVNPHVAVVFGHDIDEFITVQLEGAASEVANEDDLKKIRKIHVANNSESEKYVYLKENIFFKVRPSWVRYWDFHKDEKIEVEF